MTQKVDGVVPTQLVTQTVGTGNDAFGAADDKFAKLFSASSDALVICRQVDDCILDVNEAFVHLLGYSHAQARGRTLTDLDLYVHPEDAQTLPGKPRSRPNVVKNSRRNGCAERMGWERC